MRTQGCVDGSNRLPPPGGPQALPLPQSPQDNRGLERVLPARSLVPSTWLPGPGRQGLRRCLWQEYMGLPLWGLLGGPAAAPHRGLGAAVDSVPLRG